MLNFYIQGQYLRASTPRVIVSDTIRYIQANFTFSPDWEGMEKYIHFQKDEDLFDVTLDNDKITKEHNVNLTAGIWECYIHGDLYRDGEVYERAVTDKIQLTVVQSGMLEGQPFPQPTPSETEQMLSRIVALEGREEEDPTVPAWAKNEQMPSYTKEETDDRILELNQYVIQELEAVDEKLDEKEKLLNKSETLASNQDNTHYPTVKAVVDYLVNYLNSSSFADNMNVFNRTPNKILQPSNLDYAVKVALNSGTAWSSAEKEEARKKLGLDEFVLPVKKNQNGTMNPSDVYALADGLYYFIKPVYNASDDGKSIHGMCSISEHFVNNYDYGIYFGDFSASAGKYTTTGSIDGYGQIEREYYGN